MNDGLFQGIDSPTQMDRVQGHDDWASWKVMNQVYLTSMPPPMGRHPDQASLPNTEPTEDHPQQVVGGNGAGDAAQGLMGQAQFFGKEVQRLVAQGHMLTGVLKVGQRFGKRLQMALAGDENAFLAGLETGDVQKLAAEGFNALPCAGGKA